MTRKCSRISAGTDRPDLGCGGLSHRSVTGFFSPICHFPQRRAPPDLPGGGQPTGTGGRHGESVVAGLAPVSNREPEAVVVTGVPGGIGYAIAHAFATPRVSPFV